MKITNIDNYSESDLLSTVEARQLMYEWHEKADTYASFLAKGTISLEEYVRFTNKDFKQAVLKLPDGSVIQGLTVKSANEKTLEEMTVVELEDTLDNHDCHLSPSDSCQCVALISELRSR